jgi:NTE family protein
MKIGLALGSGAARGWAHIGIIQALEALGIKIDVVAGCSIGAYVGAAYTSNKLEQLAEWAEELTEWQVLSLFGLGINRGGLASGNKIFQALSDKFSEQTFEQQAKPLAVVATDLYSGREVAFTSGPIDIAVRASCAIPGLLPPQLHENRWLVDGAVVNPVPVNLCRRMGADFVIAVNLRADYRPEVHEQFKKEHENNQRKTNDFFSKSQVLVQQWFYGEDKAGDEEPVGGNSKATGKPAITQPGIFSVMSSSLEILQARVTRSRLAGEPPDVLIEPQLRDFSMMEFYRANELIDEGQKSVHRLAEQIKYQLRLD